MPKQAPPARSRLKRVTAATPHLYAPTAERPLRAKHSRLAEDTHVEPHRHAWAQLAWSATGVLRLTTDGGTYLVPPSRAVWIPPGVEHAVTVVESAELCTLYLHQTEIATLFGFVELGRFSVEYRKVYGESPSKTLQRSPTGQAHADSREQPSARSGIIQFQRDLADTAENEIQNRAEFA